MATIHVTKTLSDLTGEEIPDGDAETVLFSLDGKSYEIDLSTKEAGELREKLAVYVGGGRKVPTGPQKAPGSRRATSGSSDVAEARAWLREHGYDVKEKGRIPADLMDAYRLGKDVERGVTLETRGDATVVVEPQAAESAPQDEDTAVVDEATTEDSGPTDDTVSQEAEPPAEGVVSDDTVIAWHQAKGYKLSLTKDGAPNGLMRARYLKATG